MMFIRMERLILPHNYNKVTPSVAKVHVFNEARPANTGDGYSLLKAVNAEFSNNDVYKNGTIDFAPQLFITWNTVPDYSKTMLIDENGKRFSNEAPYNFLNLTTEMYKHGSEKYRRKSPSICTCQFNC